ncbi:MULTISPECIES: GNAT family N-acetyltransferase [Photorhabdus]|nr:MULTISPECIES: GNAT family N-acetyltransferase [Photorhabdus]MCC8374886.1 GNAT family N-acetyltransferase [Photorhabdus bodei]MCC8465218.1 GNAT family N-acetyltransferase [Photorhabdus bodei]MCT8353992.1 GNAT family N-acetyltransferase [Photorhabdus kayaii]MDB6369972.1 GNAT family N-acetyltransferase [Photorhabdus bodei]MDB6373533.1 GNAT family N-acetyltransferase [Photorhabdus bodei]
MKIAIRLANTTEQLALEALQLRASLMWEEDRELLLANPHMIELPIEYITAGYVYIAEQANVILGFCVVLPLSDGNAELDGIFVEPGFWHQGIGKQLVQITLNDLHIKGKVSLQVLANPQAEGFYIALGFKYLGKEYTQLGTAIRMIKYIR